MIEGCSLHLGGSHRRQICCDPTWVPTLVIVSSGLIRKVEDFGFSIFEFFECDQLAYWNCLFSWQFAHKLRKQKASVSLGSSKLQECPWG